MCLDMAGPPAPSAKTFGANNTYARRSRAGCWTCRRLHKKCDEKRPRCGPCVRVKRHCEGYEVRLTWKDGRDGHKSRTRPEGVSDANGTLTAAGDLVSNDNLPVNSYQRWIDSPLSSITRTTPAEDPPAAVLDNGHDDRVPTSTDVSSIVTEDSIQAGLLEQCESALCGWSHSYAYDCSRSLAPLKCEVYSLLTHKPCSS